MQTTQIIWTYIQVLISMHQTQRLGILSKLPLCDYKGNCMFLTQCRHIIFAIFSLSYWLVGVVMVRKLQVDKCTFVIHDFDDVHLHQCRSQISPLVSSTWDGMWSPDQANEFSLDTQVSLHNKTKEITLCQQERFWVRCCKFQTQHKVNFRPVHLMKHVA